MLCMDTQEPVCPAVEEGKEPLPRQCWLSWLRTLHPNSAEERGAKILVHTLERWWLAEVGCQGFCRSAWVSELP